MANKSNNNSSQSGAKNYYGHNVNDINRLRFAAGYSNNHAANAANLYGLNHRDMKLATQRNTDQQGYVFFTRPDLNLSYHNLRQSRHLSLLANPDDYSIWKWVRATLDPRSNKNDSTCNSYFCDKENPFIPILSNNIKSLSGWGDNIVEPTSSESGYYNEAVSIADGPSEDYSVKTLNASFNNQIQDPINRLFYYWTKYSMLAHEGIVDPYLNNLVMNRMDYNTRIYRIVLDQTKQYVQHIGAIGAGFPISAQLASKFDYQENVPLQNHNDEVSTSFTVMGMMYDDPILVKEFNTTVVAFCRDMGNDRRGSAFKAIPLQYIRAFNGIGLPWIDEYTGKLDWYVRVADYNTAMAALGAI